MPKFRIELHCHTSYNSGCSVMDAETLVEMYLAKGYSGIVISDHFTRHEIESRR